MLQTCIRNAERKVLMLLLARLEGHVLELLLSPHGNYVLTHAIRYSYPSYVKFIADEVSRGVDVTKIAMHNFGSRVLEHLIAEDVDMDKGAIEKLVMKSVELSKSQFARFVLAAMLLANRGSRTCSFGVINEILKRLLPQMDHLCCHHFAHHVMQKMFDARVDGVVKCGILTHFMTLHRGISFIDIACHKHGHKVVTAVLVLREPETHHMQRQMVGLLRLARHTLHASFYGRQVQLVLEKRVDLH